MLDIGQELREKRIDAGLTQRNVADIKMWDIAKISRIENDKQEITYREYLELEELYASGRKVDEFTVNDYEHPARVLQNV
jgi:transcriptional regulator with XRE-family HTH domain